MLDLVRSIRDEIDIAIKNDDLKLPVLPEVALAIRDETSKPNIDARSLASVVGRDPSVSGRLINVANSAVYRGAVLVEDLSTAISRIGIENAANISTALAMKQIYQSDNAHITRELRESWEQATEVAGIATLYARTLTNLGADQAGLAGIMHNVGVLPVFAFAADREDLCQDPETLRNIAQELHPDLGSRILREWGFAESISNVPTQYLNVEQDTVEIDLTDVVRAAYIQSIQGSEHFLATKPLKDIPTMVKLGLADSEGGVEEIGDDMIEATKRLYE